jgi:hypothetical protein
MSFFSNLFSKAKADVKAVESKVVDDYHTVLADIRAELPVLHSRLDSVETYSKAQFDALIAKVKALEATINAAKGL